MTTGHQTTDDIIAQCCAAAAPLLLGKETLHRWWGRGIVCVYDCSGPHANRPLTATTLVWAMAAVATPAPPGGCSVTSGEGPSASITLGPMVARDWDTGEVMEKSAECAHKLRPGGAFTWSWAWVAQQLVQTDGASGDAWHRQRLAAGD